MSFDFDKYIPPKAYPIHILRKTPSGRGYPPNCTSEEGITEGALAQLQQFQAELDSRRHLDKKESMDNGWRQIKDYPGYWVHKDGWVYSEHKGDFFKSHPDSNGYLQVDLCRKGEKPRPKQIHRLVLEAFVGPCPPGHQACHNNGIKTDNRLSNLRWDTPRNNNLDRCKHHKGQYTSDYPGVSWYSRYKKWHAQIQVNGKKKHLGYFDSETEAAHAYTIAYNNLDKK